jgi:hypothetical protein
MSLASKRPTYRRRGYVALSPDDGGMEEWGWARLFLVPTLDRRHVKKKDSRLLAVFFPQNLVLRYTFLLTYVCRAEFLIDSFRSRMET